VCEAIRSVRRSGAHRAGEAIRKHGGMEGGSYVMMGLRRQHEVEIVYSEEDREERIEGMYVGVVR
jgi:hypothetical protein